MTSRPMELSRLRKAVALCWVEASGGFIDNDELWLTQQCLRDSEALLHAAGVGAERFFADIPEIGLMQEGIDDLVALALVCDALHYSEMMQHVGRGDFGIYAKFLWKISEDFANFCLVRDNVEPIEIHAACIGSLERSHRPHQGAFSSAVGTE